jgi:hypothetical protein
MTEPTFDRDGYPTEETLEAIRKWDCDDPAGKIALLRFVQKAWSYPLYFTKIAEEWHVSTGGWSGNEDLIRAMRKNFVFWSLTWVQERRGGHYIFEVTF